MTRQRWTVFALIAGLLFPTVDAYAAGGARCEGGPSAFAQLGDHGQQDQQDDRGGRRKHKRGKKKGKRKGQKRGKKGGKKQHKHKRGGKGAERR